MKRLGSDPLKRGYGRNVLTVLAHQGGWDEVLWVAGPLAVVAGMLLLANRRANKIAAERESPSSEG